MDPTLVLNISLDSSASPECSGVPKFSGVSEIGDLRQDKAENSDEIWMLQLFGKVFLCMNTAFVSSNWCFRSGYGPNHVI